MPKNDKQRWADEEEEEEVQVPTSSSGVQERITYSTNAKGQTVKTTTKVRVKEFKTRVPLRVETRKNLPRFGDAKIGEENVTLPSRDYVSIEHPDDATNDDADDPTLAKTLANFISKQQERGMARDFNIDNFDEIGKTGDGEETGKTDRYVAPGRGGGVSAAGDFGFGNKDKDSSETTLRVSNLTKAVTEEDLRDLFERFGRIHRISLPRVEKDGIKEPKGFAYIAYARHEDAEKALELLQGHRYDHLILKLEWARPTKGDGERNPNFMSGYGKQLVQDTKEKVYYASNLTGNA